MFSGLKIVFSKLNVARYHYLHKKSSIIETLNTIYKNICLYNSISSKFFCTNLSKVKLEILQPFSEAATGGTP